METAKCSEVQEHEDGYVYWRDHVPTKSKTGRIAIRIHPDVLTSDEAIVAVLQHEVFELSAIYDVCLSNPHERMSASDYHSQVRTHNPGNFHCQAWEVSDKRVLWMRAVKHGKSA